MIAALFSGIGWRGWLALTAGLLLMAAVVVKERRDRETGAARERERIEAANKAAGDKADAAERGVLDCQPPRQWIRGQGCVSR